ncbi:MAG TPA: hypothetical protein VM187_11635 [Niastella sp.]|nr:hypothetical protein [Niastella sp.]
MEQHDKQDEPQQAEQKQNTGQGRVPDSQAQPVEGQEEDISQVDQQEGQMENGRLGGNFDAAGNKTETTQKKP